MAQKKYYIGLDVGGTKIGAGLVSSGKIIKQIKVPTEAERGAKRVINNVEKATEELFNKNIAGIGIGIAGQVDNKKDIFFEGPNLPDNLKNIHFKKIFEKKFGVRTEIDNDAHCFTLAESIYGAGKKYETVLGITIGTGIGGGLCINKKIYRGGSNITTEIGHMTIDPSTKFKCSCGKRGHLEALASGTAMISWYKHFTSKTKDTFFIEKEAMAGKAPAEKSINKMSRYLGLGLANLVHLLNPDIIIIGGGIARVKIMWPPLLKHTKQNIVFPKSKQTKIIKTKLGDEAPILGAALLTMEK